MVWNQNCTISEIRLLCKCYQNGTQGYEVSKCCWKKRLQQICSTQGCHKPSICKNCGVYKTRVRNAVPGCNLKNDRMIYSFPSKPFNITVIQVYALTSNAEEAEVEQFHEDLQDLLELTPPKRCPFHYRGLECKSKKSRDTWSNRQIWPWSTEWSRAKANKTLPRDHTDHNTHPLSTTQEKTLHMDITRWSTPKSYWLYSL